MAEINETLTLKQKLLAIQTKLDAPKSQYNNHGGYSYRSCEDILSAVKPLNEEYKTLTTLSDAIEMIGDRYYVASIATIHDLESNETIEIKAYAREALDRKGMDDSQITGATSSYSRKYALNGLYAIDDTKDADTNEHRKERMAYSKPANRQTAKPASSQHAATKPSSSPAPSQPAQQDGVPCEVPNCFNTIRKVVEQQNRSNHDGHAICQFHHTNGNWKAALERGANPETGELVDDGVDPDMISAADATLAAMNNPQVTVNPDGSTAPAKEVA